MEAFAVVAVVVDGVVVVGNKDYYCQKVLDRNRFQMGCLVVVAS